MQKKLNRQNSFEEVELSLEGLSEASTNSGNAVDLNDDNELKQTEFNRREIFVETTQVVSSSRTMPSEEKENALYAAVLMVSGVLIVVAVYAGLVLI